MQQCQSRCVTDLTLCYIQAEGMVDIKHKRCIAEGCSKRPSFNYTGEMRALYCGPHKLDGMVNVDQERRTCNRGVHLLSFSGELSL